MIRFSIVIPTFNRADFLIFAINSVSAQSYSNWELIIIDDGSTDKTAEVVRQLKDKRIKYFYQENAERSAARNNGIMHAKGEYICFLDSDDEFNNTYLEELHKEIENREYEKAVFMGKLVFKQNKTIIKSTDPFSNEKDLPQKLLKSYSVIPCLQCVHRDIFEKYKFHPDFSLWEDTHLFLRIFENFNLYPVHKAIIFVNTHTGSTVAQNFNEVSIDSLNRYLAAINDLDRNIDFLKTEKNKKKIFKSYRSNKIRMYFYQAKTNKQYAVAFRIGLILLRNKFNLTNLFTFVKLFPSILLRK